MILIQNKRIQFLLFIPRYLLKSHPLFLGRSYLGEKSQSQYCKNSKENTSFPIKRELPDRIPKEGNVFTLHEIINLYFLLSSGNRTRLLTRVYVIEKLGVFFIFD